MLYAANYGYAASAALDPMEKKPLYHFYPGSTIFSLGAVGCNLKCGFCQNWQISQQEAPAFEIPPDEAIRLARAYRSHGCVGLAYTYSEPFMWYEWVLDTCRLARREGLKNVLVTNGFINEDPLQELLPLVDAMNIDVKAFRPGFYRRVCKGKLEPVLATVERAYKAGCHVEVTTLLIPGLNDSDEELEALAGWLASLGEDIPYHLSRYFPNYQFDLPPTPLATLERARRIARKKLRYVYLGNAPAEDGNHTRCHQCGQEVILRDGFGVKGYRLRGKCCDRCGAEIHLVGEPC